MRAETTTGVTPRDVAGATVRVGEPGYVDGVLHWVTTRPGDAGCARLVREGATGVVDVTPPGVSVRSSLYGYGAAAWCASAEGLVVLDHGAGSLCVLDDGSVRQVLDPGVRLGDPCAVPGAPVVVVVAEGRGGTGLWAVDLATGRHWVLREVDGFLAEPTVCATGERIAWVQWPKGRMPWDAATVMCAELSPGAAGLRGDRRVDGGEGNSAGQPCWLDGGELAYVAESAGWWQPWLRDTGGVTRRLTGRRAEFQRPRWTTCRWLAAMGGDRLGVACADADGEHVGVLSLDGGLVELDQPCVRVDGVAATQGRLGFVGATVAAQGAVLEASSDGGVREVVLPAAPAPGVPSPEGFRVACGDHDLDGVLWRPTAGEGTADAVATPLVLNVHPGPTGATDRSYAGAVHLLCASGVAVASLDTSGSTAHGRAHRERLTGRFGELDVDECVAAIDALVRTGVARPDALYARGTSAGGTTSLLLLARGSVRGAIAWYPASDLTDEAVGFEEGYLGSLTGGEGASRSPLAKAGSLRGRVLLVQGRQDPIVPLAETEALAVALRSAGVDVTMVVLDGEGHGLRTVEARATALNAELEFLGPAITDAGSPRRYDRASSPPTPPPVRP